jgi:hypothetical protein
MLENLPQSVLDAADVTAVTQLVLRERESRDLGRWNTMRDCFWPDSIVRITWFQGSGYDFVKGSIDMARRGVLAKHRLGPVLVRLSGRRAVASLTGIIDIPVEIKGVAAMLSAHARLLYRAENRGSAWRLFGFDAVYMRDELAPSIPGQVLAIDPAQLVAFRPSYRMLAYNLKLQGYDVDPNLAGEDRPDSADALMTEIFSWAGLSVPD